ncbi:UNVERIFIED_CONTAM: hypothetical protein Sradi_4903400 [Sesamum radiatum]|uniref:Uncharacterized protein n=1 Tax=Sesamum radiatum TaxID=300843 RepID=A0AAW2MCZ2_SESRA
MARTAQLSAIGHDSRLVVLHWQPHTHARCLLCPRAGSTQPVRVPARGVPCLRAHSVHASQAAAHARPAVCTPCTSNR